jgi:hypothetical protein
LRFGASLLVSAIATVALIALFPRRLSVVTDIVGYPIHANYHYMRLFWRYWTVVLFFPAVAAAAYHFIGLRWPEARWPDSSPNAWGATRTTTGRTDSSGSRTRREIWRTSVAVGGAELYFRLSLPVDPSPFLASSEPGPLPAPLRALAVGATLGLGLAFVDPAHFWPNVSSVAVGYAVLLWAIAPRGAPFVNAVCAPLTLFTLYAASRSTHVDVATGGSVAYPWLPGWLAVLAASLLIAVIAARLWREAPAARRIEEQALLFIVGPVVVIVFTASLMQPWSWFDTFHYGEALVGARLVDSGAFPWRDVVFIHGLLQDVLTGIAGFRLLGRSAWGGWGAFGMVLTPLWWVAHYLLFVWLFRRNIPLLIAALVVPIIAVFGYVHHRFSILPFILLAFAALLERATIPRAFLFAFVLVASNVLVPELAYAVPACGAVLIAFELERGEGMRRTLWTAVAGLALTALWFGWLARHGAAGAFVHYYATFAPGHALTGAIRQEPNAPPEFFIYLAIPPLVVLLAFWYVVAAVRQRWRLETRDWVMLALAVITMLYYQKFLSRPDWHVLHSVVPALPLLYYALHKLLGRAAGWAALAATLLVGAKQLNAPASLPSRFTFSVPSPPALESLGWSWPQLAEEIDRWRDIRRVVDATLEPSDALFDFTNQPALYHFFLERKPATRYYHVSMAIRRKTQLDLIEELDRVRPKLVVYGSEGGLFGWDGVPNEVRHYEISAYILRHYRPWARLRDQVFYLRNDLQREPPPPAVRADYSDVVPCDWGAAPAFLRTDWLETGPAVENGFELPAGAAGLEFEVETSANSTIVIAEGISFRLAGRWSGKVRVPLDDCPQWYSRQGLPIEVRYGDGVIVRGMRLLTRPRSGTPTGL